MIPKTIHYCWFGRNPKPKLATKCIRSWRKYCVDYEILEWNEDNFDVSSAPLYVRQAYEAKKWAFVSDYVRLWAMVTFGGIYMDTDVELIKPIDRFLEHNAFSGFEDGQHVPTGIMACCKDFPLFKELMSFYDTARFLNEDGSFNQTTNTVLITSVALSHGLKQNNEYQVISGLALYPKDVFCPVSYSTGMLEKTENSVAIHWFAGSWHTAKERDARLQYLKHIQSLKRKEVRINLVHNIVHLPNSILKRILKEKQYESLKRRLKSPRRE